MGLPTREEEVQILDTYMTEDPLKKLTAVMDQETLERMQKEAMEVYVHPTVRGYLADLSAATRSSDQDCDGGQSQRNDRTDACLQGVGISGRQKLCDTG